MRYCSPVSGLVTISGATSSRVRCSGVTPTAVAVRVVAAVSAAFQVMTVFGESVPSPLGYRGSPTLPLSGAHQSRGFRLDPEDDASWHRLQPEDESAAKLSRPS